ncbi:MAG: L-threonylcarbamoyladenylate synthase [Candidatus Diapherotrites archaeon]
MTKVFKLTKNNSSKITEECAAIMRKGGVVVYPTETSYGIGCSVSDTKAIRRIYRIKKRRLGKPMPIIVSDLEMAERYVKLDKIALALIKKFMPGPLTITTHKKKPIPNELSKDGIAFRISRNVFARTMSKKLGKAIVSTSANIDESEIYSGKKVISRFENKVDAIVDAGKLERNKTSTIYNTLNGKTVRHGPVKVRDIKNVLRGLDN